MRYLKIVVFIILAMVFSHYFNYVHLADAICQGGTVCWELSDGTTVCRFQCD